MLSDSFILRREKYLMKYLIKLYKNDRNSASLVLEDKKFYNLEFNFKSTYKCLIESFIKHTGLEVSRENILANYSDSPWSDVYEQVDLSHQKDTFSFDSTESENS